jgi:hypothetical protein
MAQPVHTEPTSLVDFKEKGPIMATRKTLAIALAAVMAFSVSPLFAQQTNGVISGSADDEAKQPYSDYSVQLRDAATGQIVNTVQLNGQGQFSFENVGLGRRLLVELLNVKDKNTVCTEGPYVLAPGQPSKTNVNIDCGKAPAAFWLLAAGAGTAAAIALAEQSPSQ